MLLRICLIAVTVLSLATLGITLGKVKPAIEETRAELDDTKDRLAKSQSSEQAARRAERAAKESLTQTTADLETTKADLEDMTAKAEEQIARANDLETRLNDTTRSKNEAQAQLAEWQVFGVTPQRVREVLQENERMTADMAAVNKENVVLGREVLRLENRLSRYEGGDTKVPLPPGLRGTVIAVDPKYEFVVLDRGEEDGVLERGEMLVSRQGKLVAKVQIMSVQPNRSIANILPEWKQADIMEGDVVLVGL
jgi:hypothetical protein